MKKTVEDTFPSVVAPVRKTRSEPFLASWDFSAPHVYDSMQGAISPRTIADDEEGEGEGDLLESVDYIKEGEPDTNPMDDGAPNSAPAEYFARLERLQEELTTEKVDDNARVVSGTLDGLFATLVADRTDRGFVETFLATHRYFTTSIDLMQKLHYHYVGVRLDSVSMGYNAFRHARAKQSVIRQRIVKIVKTWVDLFFSDFLNNNELRVMLDAFQEVVGSVTAQAQSWRMLCIARGKAQHRVDERSQNPPVVYRNAPKSLIPVQSSPSLLDFSPVELARQLTLLDWSHFSVVPNHEFCNKAWNEPGPNGAPFLRKYIDVFNQMCYWAATEIVLTPNPKQRSVVIERFIELAHLCVAWGNFNTMMAIHLALNLAAVTRLKTAWKEVSPKHLQTLKEIEAIADPSHNYANYRARLAAAQPPVIPFQALYLKELTFIEENVDKLESGWINFDKLYLLGKVMVSIARLQIIGYKFNEVEVVMNYLKRPPIVLNDKELVQGSRQCEPSQDYAGTARESNTAATRRTTHRLSVRLSRGFSAVRHLLPKGHEDL